MGKQRKKTRRDVAEIARSVVEQAIGETLTPRQDEPFEDHEPDKKNPAAVELGRRGGKKGGVARAKKLTAERRSEIAKQAARSRWQKP